MSTVVLLVLAFSLADSPDLSSREFKRMRAEAKTEGDYRQLASYAGRQAADFRRKVAECQEELDGYTSGAVPYPTVPKSPNRVQTLHLLISHYRKNAERWAEIGKHYLAKAESPHNHKQSHP